MVDNSLSALGPAERRYHPLALIEAIVQVFTQAGPEVSCHYVGPAPRDGFLEAEGATDLRRPLVEALLTRPELVVILSDGYENVRAGGVNQVLGTRAFRSSGIAVLHLNPVPAAESGGVRSLTGGPMTFALTAIEQLPVIALIGLAARDPRRSSRSSARSSGRSATGTSGGPGSRRDVPACRRWPVKHKDMRSGDRCRTATRAAPAIPSILGGAREPGRGPRR